MIKRGPWSTAEDAFLRKQYGKLRYRVIAKKLERSYEDVKHRAIGMGINLVGGCMADNSRDNQYMQKVWREIHG